MEMVWSMIYAQRLNHEFWAEAEGSLQVEGVDFDEIFAPVAKFNTIRVILTIGAATGLEMHQMDIKTAFLNGELDMVIFM